MDNTKEKIKILAKKKGVVVSNKMDKTIVVAVTEFKTHPKYLKKYKSTKKYQVHAGDGKYNVGDIVEIMPCRPMSKNKYYKVA